MSPRPDVSAERRAQIIQAALACFSRKGYRNTTMDDIVAASRLSKGTLYWYFKSKDDLFVSAITSALAEVGQEVVAALERCTTASEKMRALALEQAKFCNLDARIFNLIIEFWGQSSSREEASQLWTNLLVQFGEIVTGIIEEGVRNGEFKPVDAGQLAWALMATYDGLVAYVALVPGIDLERVSEVFVETLLSGLVVRESGQGAD